LIGRRGGLGG
jgi:hypothetical protein